MLNPTVQAAVRETIIEWYEEFTRFVGVGSVESTETSSWAPSYLPEGYVEVSRLESDVVTIRYENDRAILLTLIYSNELNDFRVDNEGAEYVTEEIDGIMYYCFIAEEIRKPSNVVWTSDGYSFDLNGCLDIDELLRVSVSIQKQN